MLYVFADIQGHDHTCRLPFQRKCSYTLCFDSYIAIISKAILKYRKYKMVRKTTLFVDECEFSHD